MKTKFYFILFLLCLWPVIQIHAVDSPVISYGSDVSKKIQLIYKDFTENDKNTYAFAITEDASFALKLEKLAAEFQKYYVMTSPFPKYLYIYCSLRQKSDSLRNWQLRAALETKTSKFVGSTGMNDIRLTPGEYIVEFSGYTCDFLPVKKFHSTLLPAPDGQPHKEDLVPLYLDCYLDVQFQLRFKGGVASYAFPSGTVLSAIPTVTHQPQYDFKATRGKNRVCTFESNDGTLDSGLLSVDYIDGLGRVTETSRNGYLPQAGNLVSLHEYDAYNRNTRTWLEAAIDGNGGAWVNPKVCDSVAQETYHDKRPYSIFTYENASAGRLMNSWGPGMLWEEADETRNYTSNVGEAGELGCLRITPVGAGVKKVGWYPAGSLRVLRTIDTDQCVAYTFTDRQGRTLMHRRIDNSYDKSIFHDTYYIYDGVGNLLYVLPPSLSIRLDESDTLTAAELDELGFCYKYDDFNRQVGRNLPGASFEEQVYDVYNRPVFSRDGNLRSSGLWKFCIYDGSGRICLEGVCGGFRSTSSAGTPLQVSCRYTGVSTSDYYGYSIFGVELESPEIHRVVYYDHYLFLSDGQIRPLTLYEWQDKTGYGSRSSSASGFMTGELLAQLGSVGSSLLPTVYYYDARGRVVQRHRLNQRGEQDSRFVEYNFQGQPLKELNEQWKRGRKVYQEFTGRSYDSQGLPLRVVHRTDLNDTVLLSDREYDVLGRTDREHRNGTPALGSRYAYNLRGWLTGIDGGLFSQKLFYADGGKNRYYGGNISSMMWQAGGDSLWRGYRFSYDNLKRLWESTYGEGSDLALHTGRFTERAKGYDRNGNMLGLHRFGRLSSGEYGMMDALDYTYEGNRLMRVDDGVSVTAYAGVSDFQDGANQADEYAYDANGNLTKDLNRNICEIQYNILNLPRKVVFAGGDSISYVYAADGTKLRSMATIGGVTTKTDYCGNVIYENGFRKYLLVDGGYVTLSDGKYHYYLRDHQGNNRVVAGADGTVEEVNHYYPFGGVFASSGNAQPYKYNGKELEKSLPWYDYGARRYDAVLGRFTTVDPSAEKTYSWSPYAYCYDNPVLHVDPTGKFGETVWDVFNVILGIDSFKRNFSSGNYKAAAVDGAGVLLDAASSMIPFVPGGAGAAIKGARAADKAVDAVQTVTKAEDAAHALGKGKHTVETANVVSHVSGKLTIEIAPENKIDRSLLNPPTKRGNAPTFKDTKEPVEIHHVGQNPNGPFKEMSSQEHRGKGNFKKNHPFLGEPSKIDRNEFNKAKEEYWIKEYGQ